MKRLFLTFLSIFLGLQAFAQLGNEWVKFNQPYYKLSVAKDGLYRLTYSDLQNAGFPVTTTNPQSIQIFHRGIEQKIRVTGQSDGVFNTSDYVEFLGLKNTGVSDNELYQPGTQPHKYYNLYSDTTAYFLTISSSAPGLRIELFSEVNFGLPAEISHTDEKLLVLSEQYSTGKLYHGYVQNTFFETGEGWTGTEISTSQSKEYTLTNILNTSQSSGNPILEVQLVGRQDVNHQVQISAGPSAPVTQVFFGEEVVTSTGAINWTDIGADGKLVVRVNVTSGRLSVNYIKLTYPQTFNAAGATEKVFTLNPNPGNKSYLEIQNAAPNTQLFDITYPYDVWAIDPKGTTTLKPVVENTYSSRKIFATSVFYTPPVKRISFRNFSSAGEYIIISNKALMKPASGYTDAVKAFAEYRASMEGGSYDTLVAEMDQLYNQFNYGEISPMAITRFMRYLEAQGNPKYLFLIGKGLDVQHNYHRNPTAFAFKDLVPTAGMPASDIYFTTNLLANPYEPAVATGRITASTPQEVAAYLNKVKEAEGQPFDGLWRKDLLHLSGGIGDGEPLRFKLYLQEFEAIAEDYYLGGSVTAIAKTNSGFDQIFNISDYVNKGLNLVTLFGHSSPGQNDVNVGFVSAPELEYNNKGKYPMFLINGCNAGDFFALTTRYGEDWIHTPSKGAVGFMANTSFGFDDKLRDYSRAFYSIGYGDSVFIHKGIGDIQKEVVKQLTANDDYVLMVTQAQQMLLLGDPAVPLFGANKPDYEINNTSLFTESFTTESITALSDSFALKIIVRNFGRAKKDTLEVSVTRALNDGSTITYDSTYLPVLYRDTLTFTIPRDGKGFGNTTFTVKIDPNGKASELNEDNNTAELTMLIPLNAARSLYPQGFAIVNSLSTNLVAQSTNILDDTRDFIIQLDTTNRFDSPFRKEFTVTAKIAKQAVDLLASADTLAYYWRVRFAQAGSNESGDWSTTSFTYIKNGSEGWAQVDFPQYLSNQTVGLIKDTEGRKLELQETVTNVSIRTFGVDHPGFIHNTAWGRIYHPQLSVKINDSEFHPVSLITATPALGCRKNSINLIAFNKTTALPYIPVAVQYPDARACGRRPEIITNYTSSDIIGGDGKSIVQYVDNVAVGDSVVLFSLGSPGYDVWSPTVFNKLAELGISSAQINALQAGEPVVIFSRKGSSPGSAVIKRTSSVPAASQSLLVETTVTGRYVSGEMKSSRIGPATAWDKITFATAISELPLTDELSFDIIQIQMDGTELVWADVNTPEVDLSGIDATQYPYIQLVFHATDEINLTPPQLKNWIVEYTPAAEGVLIYNDPKESQTLSEGESFTNRYSFMNISEKHFSDSLLVNYTIYNKSQRTTEVLSKKIFAPEPGLETQFELTYETENKAGLNDVRVFVNPHILPELYYDNNLVVLSDFLNVQADVFNPVLDVTVDGRPLKDGDFVSANPAILIKVWDENPIKFKTDTIGVRIYLWYPNGSQTTPIYFDRDDIQWFPATATSEFRVLFKPKNLPEGTYTLQINAEDHNGNESGRKPYLVTFVVTPDKSILISKPYPNPSQGNVYFKLTLSGDQHPDTMMMEIMNANGQIVYRLTKTDLFVGENELVWMRENSAGSMVPDGMYLYRMILTSQGSAVKTATGKFIIR